MGGIGPEKIILLLIVVLLLFGAKRLPEIGASLGKGIREFKGSLSDANPSTAEREPRNTLPRSTVDETRVQHDDEVQSEPKRLI